MLQVLDQQQLCQQIDAIIKGNAIHSTNKSQKASKRQRGTIKQCLSTIIPWQPVVMPVWEHYNCNRYRNAQIFGAVLFMGTTTGDT